MENISLEQPQQFIPLRKRGLILQGAIAIFLLASSGILFWLAFQEQYGTFFLLFLLVGLLLLIPTAGMLYRTYALWQARYILERNGFRLRWGLRAEDIPLPDVEWVRPVSDLTFPLPLPRLSYPGAVLGTRQVEGLGAVEFLASEPEGLLLVATSKKIYAISPAEPGQLLNAFARSMELGSLAPIESLSVRPAFFIRQIWADKPARWLLLAGLAVSLILLAVTSLLIPGLSEITLGFSATGQDLAPLPANRLLLLPILGLLCYTGDLLSGLFFHRKGMRQAAILLWAAGIITPLLLVLAVRLITMQ